MRRKTKKEVKQWYWIAINRDSAAASAMPCAEPPTVRPTPEQLLGFSTRDEQVDVQRFLLEKPIEEVNEFMQSLPRRIESGEIRYLRPTNPEPPTRGQTLWIL